MSQGIVDLTKRVEALEARAAAQKLVVTPDNGELADIIRHGCPQLRMGATVDKEIHEQHILSTADAILARFGPMKLRTMPMREDWLATLTLAWSSGTDQRAGRMADAIIAKLAELAQPVEIDETELHGRIWTELHRREQAGDQTTRFRMCAEIAIAYFKERMNAVSQTSKPVSPVVTPDREALAKVIDDSYPPHMGGKHQYIVADAILSAFSPKLRRPFNQSEWARVCYDALGTHQHDATDITPDWCIVLGASIIAKLAELTQPDLIAECAAHGLVPCIVTYVLDGGRGTGDSDCGPEWPGALCNKPDPIEERAKQIYKAINPPSCAAGFPTWENNCTLPRHREPYLQAARAVESEIRAAKREVLTTVIATVYANPHCKEADAIRGLIAALDAEASAAK